MKILNPLLLIICALSFTGCFAKKEKAETEGKSDNLHKAEITLNSLYQNYSAPNTHLLRENYPFDEQYIATYLASDENSPNQYSYLWPFSGTFSAVNALFEATKDKKYQNMLDTQVLSGLEEYFDTHRNPPAYASYINSAPESDRFYDDNVWLGIDFTDTYMLTKNSNYLDKAKLIWRFIESGTDDILGGGIYWCEQKKESKNTCSNAPGSVYAFKLFEATKDSSYYYYGKELYEWTKQNLQDNTDYLYFDNISLDGKINKTKYPYNSGQMMQSAALLYKLTNQKEYLTEAQNIAKSCYSYFFTDYKANGEEFRLIKKGDTWFTAVMLRGFIELYHQDNNNTYIKAFNKNLNYIWDHSRDEKGLFNTDWSGKTADNKKWLLTQAAMIEMYARISTILP